MNDWFGEAAHQLLLGAVDDVVVPVELADPAGVEEVLHVLRRLLGELAALGDDRWHDEESDEDEHRDEAEEHRGRPRRRVASGR